MRNEFVALRNELVILAMSIMTTLKTMDYGLWTLDFGLKNSKDMAFPVRPVFTPFVVVVGGKYFLPVPECLLFDRENW